MSVGDDRRDIVLERDFSPWFFFEPTKGPRVSPFYVAFVSFDYYISYRDKVDNKVLVITFQFFLDGKESRLLKGDTSD